MRMHAVGMRALMRAQCVCEWGARVLVLARS